MVPTALKSAASWSWRLLVIAGAAAVVLWLVVTFRLVVIPFLISLLLAALLVPFCQWLQSRRWPSWAAVGVSFLGALAIIGGLVTLVVWQVRGGFEELREKSLAAVDSFTAWLAAPPFNLQPDGLADFVAQWWDDFQHDGLWDRALAVGSTAGHVVAGLLLTLFATLFLLIDGGRIWRWALSLFPRGARETVDGAATAGWRTLTSFARVQIFVAFVDAVGIGLGAWILGLFTGGFPLVIPIAVAVFLGSFIPIVGAVVTGAFAVLIALVYLGPIPAIIMLGIVLLVQQVEGHVLQPLVMGSAVKVHPLAVVFGVAAGSLIAGIPGALFAVPVIAVGNAMVRWRKAPEPVAAGAASGGGAGAASGGGAGAASGAGVESEEDGAVTSSEDQA